MNKDRIIWGRGGVMELIGIVVLFGTFGAAIALGVHVLGEGMYLEFKRLWAEGFRFLPLGVVIGVTLGVLVALDKWLERRRKG